MTIEMFHRKAKKFLNMLDADKQDRLVRVIDSHVLQGAFTWEDVGVWDAEELESFYNTFIKRSVEDGN